MHFHEDETHHAKACTCLANKRMSAVHIACSLYTRFAKNSLHSLVIANRTHNSFMNSYDKVEIKVKGEGNEDYVTHPEHIRC